MSDRGWQHFSHEADLGICGWGATLSAAFEEAGEALTAAVTHATVRPDVEVHVSCRAPNLELLFVEWLNAIIYEMAVRNMIFSRYKVSIDESQLMGTLWGEPIDVPRHEPACEPKGATYTELRVTQTQEKGWVARCVVDV